jgi:hypothetical protein
MNDGRVPAVGDTVEDAAPRDSAGIPRPLSALGRPGLLLVFFRGYW